jgi:protease PrsW
VARTVAAPESPVVPVPVRLPPAYHPYGGGYPQPFSAPPAYPHNGYGGWGNGASAYGGGYPTPPSYAPLPPVHPQAGPDAPGR